ncbi:hypothetical protein [Actinoplanes sp. NPDC089786]|uniref:hypothetical protein n=1 Tax=Actinoplanes sp. NPDC089786 TaxID=3155185 RepID=UPI00342CE5F0
MRLEWMATSPDTGRFPALSTESEPEDLVQRFDQLRARGEGYLDIRRAGNDYPALMLGFRGDDAVLHLGSDEQTLSLLRGDGRVTPFDTLEIPTPDGPVEFTGDVVTGTDKAWAVIDRFVNDQPLDDVGDWIEL